MPPGVSLSVSGRQPPGFPFCRLLQPFLWLPCAVADFYPDSQEILESFSLDVDLSLILDIANIFLQSVDVLFMVVFAGEKSLKLA